jgi:LysM repeat protein
LSVVLESLDGDSIYGMPEFEIDEELETTKVTDDSTGIDDEAITGDTYPFEEEDRRKTLMKKKRNPLFLVLFVLIGLIGIAGLLVLFYWLLTTFGVINKAPLDTGTSGERTEIETGEETGEVDTDESGSGEVEAGEESGETGTENITSDEADSLEEQESGTSTAEESAEEDDSGAEKKTEPLKTGFYYRIKKGDTLWDISANFYRDPFQWYKIYRDPRNKIKDPDLIFAGSRLYIPEN